MGYENQYMSNLENILEHGVLEKNNRTGVETYRVASSGIIVDLQEEFPILRSRYINWEVAVNELLWIFQKNSNNIKDLGNKIWDQWADENGSIGKTYGYQVGLPVLAKSCWYKNQVEYILETLSKDRSSRQAVVDMWNPGDLAEMNLPPCVYSSVWSIIDGKLNCMVVQRSADYPVGVPFDTTEYAILMHLFARHLHVVPGILTHVMADSHIYKNQVEGVKKLLKNFQLLDNQNYDSLPVLKFKDTAPIDFWQITKDDIIIENYNPIGKIKFEVAT